MICVSHESFLPWIVLCCPLLVVPNTTWIKDKLQVILKIFTKKKVVKVFVFNKCYVSLFPLHVSYPFLTPLFFCTISQNFRLCRYWPALLVPTGSIRPFMSTSWRRKWTAEWPMTINSSGKNSTYVHKQKHNHRSAPIMNGQTRNFILKWHKNMASKIHKINFWCWCLSPRYALSPYELVGFTFFALQALPVCPIQAACDAASKEENKEKNRYVNILPCKAYLQTRAD